MMDVYPVLYRTGWRNQDGLECTLNDSLQLQISQPVFERIGTHLRPKAIAHSAPRGSVSLKAAEPETGQSRIPVLDPQPFNIMRHPISPYLSILSLDSIQGSHECR